MSKLLQVVDLALDAARHRRERLAALKGASLSSTPRSDASSSRVGSKRKELKKDILASASTTASSVEKVTPDPKHVRTGTDAPSVPTPKALFVSPTGGDMEVDGGLEFTNKDSKLFLQDSSKFWKVDTSNL